MTYDDCSHGVPKYQNARKNMAFQAEAQSSKSSVVATARDESDRVIYVVYT